MYKKAWITCETLAFFLSRGFRIDVDTGKIYINQTQSWIRPDISYWVDRITLLHGCQKVLSEAKTFLMKDRN